MKNRWSPLACAQVEITDPFWTGLQNTVSSRSLQTQFEQCSRTGRFENFARASRGELGTFQGRYYNDSDVYKWVEAASAFLVLEPKNHKLREQLDYVVDLIINAQMSDGYLNTFFQLQHPDLRWTALCSMHEMYCAGHLIEASISHREATGESRLLEAAVRLADHVASIFGPGKRVGFCGHEEFELALVKLGRIAGRDDFWQLASWMVLERGKHPSPFADELKDQRVLDLSPWMPGHLSVDGDYDGQYVQDHMELIHQSDAVGHAVRLMYLLCAATDACMGPEIDASLHRIWQSVTQRRMYVTGGIGSSARNEGFTKDYDLPNRSGYSETCAACGLVFWSRRMVERFQDSRYADVMELALFNAALAGMGIHGDQFFYDNPLESFGEKERSEWFDCACCPPNLARLIAKVSENFVLSDDDGIVILIPTASRIQLPVSGNQVVLRIEGRYPFSDNWTAIIESEVPIECTVRIRIPQWSRDFAIEMPDHFGEWAHECGFAVLRRQWQPGDAFKVHCPLDGEWLVADLRVAECSGKTALKRGPLVYCLEEADLGLPVWQFTAKTSEPVIWDSAQDDLGEYPVGFVTGTVIRARDCDLYHDLSTSSSHAEPVIARFIPYFLWANRARGSMQVWVRHASEDLQV